MPKYRSPRHNRLLALEQELLAKKRWAKELKSGHQIDYFKKKQTRKLSGKRHVNNRLLQLEEDLLGKYRRPKSPTKTSPARALKVEKHQSDRITFSKDKPQPRKSTANRIKSQVFDTGEPIVLQYIQSKQEVVTTTTPPTAVISVPEKTSMIETLPTLDLPVSDEKPDVVSVDNSPEIPSLVETSEAPKIEDLEPELPIIPEPVVVDSEIATEKEQETEDSLSQAAELISQVDTQPYPLQAEDILPIIAELESDRPEAPTTPVTPQKKQASDRNNPHDIFDRMGKNMAYATTFDVGTIELEQLFDEFDRTLDREEQANQDNAVSQEQDDLELERRFDEFDRTLDREENRKAATKSTAQAKSLPEISSIEPQEIFPPIVSIMRSLPREESTPVDTITPNRDPLTGMPNYEYP